MCANRKRSLSSRNDHTDRTPGKKNKQSEATEDEDVLEDEYGDKEKPATSRSSIDSPIFTTSRDARDYCNKEELVMKFLESSKTPRIKEKLFVENPSAESLRKESVTDFRKPRPAHSSVKKNY
jgi:hypothetical protein